MSGVKSMCPNTCDECNDGKQGKLMFVFTYNDKNVELSCKSLKKIKKKKKKETILQC